MLLSRFLDPETSESENFPAMKQFYVALILHDRDRYSFALPLVNSLLAWSGTPWRPQLYMLSQRLQGVRYSRIPIIHNFLFLDGFFAVHPP